MIERRRFSFSILPTPPATPECIPPGPSLMFSTSDPGSKTSREAGFSPSTTIRPSGGSSETATSPPSNARKESPRRKAKPIASSSSARNNLLRGKQDLPRPSLLEFSAHRVQDHLPKQAFMQKLDLTQIDAFPGQIPAQMLRPDPLPGLLLGRLPTQGPLFPRLHSLKRLCIAPFTALQRLCKPGKRYSTL